MEEFAMDADVKLERLIRPGELSAYAGLKRTQIADLVKSGEFPKPIKLSDGGRAVAWRESDVIAWQKARSAKGYYLTDKQRRLSQLAKEGRLAKRNQKRRRKSDTAR
jgi:prophage regulatory protein